LNHFAVEPACQHGKRTKNLGRIGKHQRTQPFAGPSVGEEQVTGQKNGWLDGKGLIKVAVVRARQDRLDKRAHRLAAYADPRHTSRMRGAARRRALASSWNKKGSISEKEAAIFHWDDSDCDYDDLSDYDAYTDYGDYNPMGNSLEGFELGLERKCLDDSSLECFGLCPICLEEKVLLELNCAHAFCLRCLLHQLASRWNGVGISFNYLQCGICRQQIGHRKLQVPMVANLAFKEKVETMALNKCAQDGLSVAAPGVLATPETMRAQAMSQIATYMCNTCYEPFCGGRIECARQQELSADEMICSPCEWIGHQGEARDQRCMLHGHSSAIYKCDFCCSIAIYRCFGNTNFCERCHNQANSNIYYPCPGASSCSLRIPHPCILTAQGEGSIRSFVLGCSACLGSEEKNDGLVTLGSPGEFGYPSRKWESFTGGDMLMAAIGEREVRNRLRFHHPSALQVGGALECAERLLLLELGVKSCAELLAGCGDRDVLARRLEAVGFRQDGNSLECADRLLSLLHSPASSMGCEKSTSEEDGDYEDMPPLEPVECDHEHAMPLHHAAVLPHVRPHLRFSFCLLVLACCLLFCGDYNPFW
jgi:hypothetical protein